MYNTYYITQYNCKNIVNCTTNIMAQPLVSHWVNSTIYNQGEYNKLTNMLPTLHMRYEVALLLTKNTTTVQLAGWSNWLLSANANKGTPIGAEIIQSMPSLVIHRLDTMAAVLKLLFYQLIIFVITQKVFPYASLYGRVMYEPIPDLSLDVAIGKLTGLRQHDISALTKVDVLIKLIVTLRAKLSPNSPANLCENMGEYAGIEMVWRTLFSVASVTGLLRALSLSENTFRMFKIGTMKKLQKEFYDKKTMHVICISNIDKLCATQLVKPNLIDNVNMFDDIMEINTKATENEKWVSKLIE